MARLEDFRNEYREVSFNFRHMASFRIGLISFYAAFVAWVTNFTWSVYQDTDSIFRVLVPFSGSLGTVLFHHIDVRLTGLYDTLVNRGQELENLLDVTNGIYCQIVRMNEGPRLRYTSKFTFLFMGLVFVCVVVVDLGYRAKIKGVCTWLTNLLGF